jgi:hypothetical protein
MKRLKFVLAGLLFTSPAFAQDATTEGEAGATAGGGAEVGAEVTTGEGAPVDANAAVDAGMAVSTTSAIDWSLLMPAGKIGVYGGYSIVKFSFSDPATGTSVSFTGDRFGVGAGYGVTDKITAGAQYAFTPGLIGDADGEFKGDLGLFGQFDIKSDDKLHLTGSAMFAIDLCGAQDPMTGDCSSAKAITAGLGARYKLAPNMAVFTGAPYGPGPVGQHLVISLEDGNAASFSLPVGFMFQATPELNINAQTSLGTIAFNDAAGESAFFGADFIPLSLGGLFAVNDKVAVEASFSLPDLKEAQFDLYIISIGARLRL